MPAIELSHVSKSFGPLKAVDDISFEVKQGEIFGLLGPNGAGKTTAIRVLLDIFKPDQGSVSILGGPMTEAKKNRIGYMPEERGLYQDIKLERCLVYLGTLKGLETKNSHQQVGEYLERFGLADSKNKKVKELSKGMQQKAQLIVTLLHKPEILIIDEPFSGLDPVNTQMVKDILSENRADGVTIVMCTHQMHQVEELCDRLVLINQGRVMLYGELGDIRQQFSGHAVLLRIPDELPYLDGVKSVEKQNSVLHLNLTPETTPQQILQQLIALQIPIQQFEVAIPRLEDIFIRVVQGNHVHE